VRDLHTWKIPASLPPPGLAGIFATEWRSPFSRTASFWSCVTPLGTCLVDKPDQRGDVLIARLGDDSRQGGALIPGQCRVAQRVHERLEASRRRVFGYKGVHGWSLRSSELRDRPRDRPALESLGRSRYYGGERARDWRTSGAHESAIERDLMSSVEK
jgi:hypothetical protein